MKMMKVVLKLGLTDEEEKKKVMKIVSRSSGVVFISVDMKEKKLTVIGDMDPVNLVSKMRGICSTKMLCMVPAKEEKKDDKRPKVVLKLGLTDEEEKKKVMQIVCGISWVVSISIDMKDKKLTVTGEMDPVNLASQLRKICSTEMLSMEPVKEEKKDDKKPEAKKNDKKVVLKLGLTGEKEKKKVMKIVSESSGVVSISMDMKEKKLTVTGDMDPVNLVNKMRKICSTEMLFMEPVKKDDKKPEAKKNDKKVVLKLGLTDEKEKKKVMKIVSGSSGFVFISVDMKEKKLTVIGDMDPVNLVSKMRRICSTKMLSMRMLSMGPAKKNDKKPEDKKDDKKPEAKKDDKKPEAKKDDKKPRA